MSARKNIISAFNKTNFAIYDKNGSTPIDTEIESFILKINKRKGIVTTNSCAGHSKEERNSEQNYNPYLAFLVNDMGWRIFWSLVLPEISSIVAVIVWVITEENSKSIILRAEDYSDKNKFWISVQSSFLTHFNK